MWDLMSPPKILGAVCKNKGMDEEQSRAGRVRPPGSSSRYLLSELDDKRQLVGLDKIQEVLLGHVSVKGVATFIKL